MNMVGVSEFWRIPLHIGIALVALLGSPVLALDVPAARKLLDAEFAEKLALLVAKCNQLGLKEEAETTRKWIVPRDPRRQTLFLPANVDTTLPERGAPKVVTQWHDKFIEHRQAQASGLFDLAKRAVEDKDVAAAVQLLNEVLREDPDHAIARKVLGYLPKDRSGVWPRAGAGLTVRESRAPIPLLKGKLWKAESGHFSIATNHSAAAGKEVGQELEKLYDVWQQLFARHWLTAADLKARLDAGKLPALGKSKRQVKLFKSHEDYLDSLAGKVPHIALSKGIYISDDQVAYFSWDEHDRANWYHEATHQLFQEIGGAVPSTGLKQNFWITEGIALYLESLTFCDGYCTLGGFDAERLQDARYKVLMEGYYVPLEDLVALGRDDFPKRADVRKLYSQMVGLSHFLMDYKQGKYRASLADYVAAVYAGRDTQESLASLTGVKLADLDAEYRAWLTVTDDDLAALKPTPHVPTLRLARTAVTDKGLQHLAGHPELACVDISHTKATDAGLAFLADSVRLKQLLLDGTGVTEASLEAIGKLRDLEELDLANLPVTDAGLAHLSGLKKLKVLYLTNTKITDAGLKSFAGMKFELFDVEGTAVTPAAAKKLMK